MISRLISLFKVGSPKVDLILNSNEISNGGKVIGEFHVQGGWIQKKINRLECDLIKECHGEKPEVVEPVKTVLMSRIIKQNETTAIPFIYQLTKELQPTSNHLSYRLQTKLVFSDDVRSKDHDEIIVR